MLHSRVLTLSRRLYQLAVKFTHRFDRVIDAAIDRGLADGAGLSLHPPASVQNLRLRQFLTRRRLELAERKLDLLELKANPALLPPPPRPDYTRDLTPEERTAILDKVDEIFGLDKPIRPPNGTVPPRTIYPAAHIMDRHPEWVAEEEAQRKALEAQGWHITPPLKRLPPNPNHNPNP